MSVEWTPGTPPPDLAGWIEAEVLQALERCLDQGILVLAARAAGPIVSFHVEDRTGWERCKSLTLDLLLGQGLADDLDIEWEALAEAVASGDRLQPEHVERWRAVRDVLAKYVAAIDQLIPGTESQP